MTARTPANDVTSTKDLAQGPVFAVGTTVYLDGGKTKATVDDKAIKSLYYTSAGVLVRHGNNPAATAAAR